MKTITGIHGVPRSGTSWLGQIFNSHPETCFKFQPMFAYKFRDILSVNSTKKEIDDFFNKLSLSDDYFVNMRDPNLHKNYPVFDKAKHTPHLVFKNVHFHFLLDHLLKSNDQLKLILLIRNPMAVLHSWYKAPREFKPEWNFNEEWRNAELKNAGAPENYFGFNKWKEAAMIFHKINLSFPERTYLLMYNDLLSDPLATTQKLFHFSGLDMHQQTIDFINDSREKDFKDDPNSVYRKKGISDNSYIDKLPEEIIQEIKHELTHTVLEKYLSDHI